MNIIVYNSPTEIILAQREVEFATEEALPCKKDEMKVKSYT